MNVKAEKSVDSIRWLLENVCKYTSWIYSSRFKKNHYWMGKMIEDRNAQI